mmetsp:Transcript_145043/g.252959  ORF Transcript_145043/g.252959 Transcript_145043/m.252959 type:complete len:83 (+) Transcript_145043:2208-2456(+)
MPNCANHHQNTSVVSRLKRATGFVSDSAKLLPCVHLCTYIAAIKEPQVVPTCMMNKHTRMKEKKTSQFNLPDLLCLMSSRPK